jgi:putative Holliday junction resolvase
MAERLRGVKKSAPDAGRKGVQETVYSAVVRVLGLDVGDVRIGVALSDETATLATGLDTLVRRGPRQDVKAVAGLARRHEAAEVVVGLPRRLDGSLGPQAEKVTAFIEELGRSVRVPVVAWDERFTTVIAERTLAEAGASRKVRKASVDKVSAVLILQSYLDSRKTADARIEDKGA